MIEPEKLAGLELPCRTITRFHEYQLRAALWHSKVDQPRCGKRSATHKAVGRRSCPPRLHRQTPNPETNPDKTAYHPGIPQRKLVRVLAFDRDRGVVPVRFGRYPDKRIEEPPDADPADLVIRLPESEIVGHVGATRDTRICGSIVQHSRPQLIQFVHSNEDRDAETQMQFRDII